MHEDSPHPTPALLPRGYLLGRHCIEQALREGGMATVYRGHHVETGAPVAIKVVHREFATHPEFTARFSREAQVMGRLAGCPQVVAVHDVGRLLDGGRYLVMEFVPGPDLDDVLAGLAKAERRLELDRVCRIMRDVAIGVDAAHRQSIVHRDVKPPNVMIATHDGIETAKITDFGISADLAEQGRSQALTAAGAILGTPEYMAPEQAMGQPATAAFDVYAMGVMLFEMLTGTPPKPNGWKLGALPDVRQLRPEVPADLGALVAECTRYDSNARSISAAEVSRRIGDVLRSLARPRSANATVPFHAKARPARSGAPARPRTEMLYERTAPRTPKLSSPTPPPTARSGNRSSHRSSDVTAPAPSRDPPTTTRSASTQPAPSSTSGASLPTYVPRSSSLAAGSVPVFSSSSSTGGSHHAFTTTGASSAAPSTSAPVLPMPTSGPPSIPGSRDTSYSAVRIAAIERPAIPPSRHPRAAPVPGPRADDPSRGRLGVWLAMGIGALALFGLGGTLVYAYLHGALPPIDAILSDDAPSE